MPQMITVISVGPALSVQGGISRVTQIIKDHLGQGIRFRLVSSFTRYIGADETHPADRGSKFTQALVFLWALVQIVFYALGRRSVFHVHISNRGSLLRKGLICALLRALRCHYAVHGHNADTELFHEWVPQVVRRILLWGVCGATRFIGISRYWFDQHASILELSPGRSLLLPNPTDLPNAIPDRMHRRGLTLLFLGRIGIRKGTFDIIRAFAELPDDVRQDCHLMLAGDGDVDAAQALGASLGCSSRMSILGWVGEGEVSRLLAEADVLLLPSRAEGMAMALLEGMSWGLPVLATAVGAHGEFLESGRNSILVKPGDIQGINEAICALARNPELRLRLGLAARETAKRFNIDTYIVTLTRLYEELANDALHA